MSDLLEAARAARLRAYAPYSNYLVGAALRGDDDQIYVGANVENAAYPQGCCAEASAISAMVMAGVQKIVEVAVVGSGSNPVPPCGGCRQRLREFADATTLVTCAGEHGDAASYTLEELLPYSFGPEFLTA